MEREPLRVLLIADDEEDVILTRQLLSKARGATFDLIWERSCREGRLAIRSVRYDVCLLDYRLGDGNGLGLLREAIEIGCEFPVIFLTGQGDDELAVAAMR